MNNPIRQVVKIKTPALLKPSQGFSLIEIMITLVILSVGLLSLGGLHITALKKTNDAHFRTEASLLLMELSNKMRTNQEGIKNYMALQELDSVDIVCQTNVTDCSGTTLCSEDQLALYDLNDIACKTKRLLPQSTVSVSEVSDATASCDASVSDTSSYYSLRLKWIENSEDGSDGEQDNEKNVTLNCLNT